MARLDHKLKSHGVKANEVKIMVIEHTVTPASNQGAPDDAPEFAPAPTTKKKELDHKHNTDNVLKNIQKRRRHFRYVQNTNNTQAEVDTHHDSVPLTVFTQ